MKHALKAAQTEFNADKVVLDAQTYVRSFYDKLGFVQTSDEFIEEGRLHIQMTYTFK